MLSGGMKYLMNHLPDEKLPNIYYWYYAPQVMHNMSGHEWDTWNRKCGEFWSAGRSAVSISCANGSWARQTTLGEHGGRVMQTSLSVDPGNLLPLSADFQGQDDAECLKQKA